MKNYDIWMEGGILMEGPFPKHLVGSISANNFEEACINFFKDDKIFNRETMTYWGCKLFDNEKDAAKFEEDYIKRVPWI